MASCSSLSSLSDIGVSPYTEKTFVVGEGEKYSVVAVLKEGQTVEGDFSVSGEQDYLDFYIKDPTGDLIYGVVRAQGSLRFTAEARNSGAHSLYFDNSFSFGAKRQVTLHYRVR